MHQDPEAQQTQISQSSTNLLRAVRAGTVMAPARSLHVGRSTITVQTELRDRADRLVAQVTQAQAVLGS